jgi:hypothetical protein
VTHGTGTTTYLLVLISPTSTSEGFAILEAEHLAGFYYYDQLHSVAFMFSSFIIMLEQTSIRELFSSLFICFHLADRINERKSREYELTERETFHPPL